MLFIFGLFFLYSVDGFLDFGQNSFVSVNEHETVHLKCTTKFNKVTWRRGNDLPLSNRVTLHGKNLLIRGVRLSDAGTYVCKSEDLWSTETKIFHVYVKNRTTTGYFTPVPPSSTAHPCYGGSCNYNGSFFYCANGEVIKTNLVCNQLNDCSDGSDEFECRSWQPKITLLPKNKVELFCGDQEELKSGILQLECTFVGYPEPLVKWKKYEGHVPSKCQQTSSNGHGKLTCPYFQQSDQGAYSCVAENSMGSAESQPKSIAKCSNTIYCNGFRVKSEESIESCLECFCSGKTTQCKNIASDLTQLKIPFTTTKSEVFAIKDGEIVFIPSESNPAPDNAIRRSSQEITYCSLSEEDFNGISFLKSYGRNIKIPRHTGKSSFMPHAPDLIIRGNGIALVYKFNMISHSESTVDVRFWPGNWYHLDKKIAKRKDLMKVLANVDTILLRCEYVQNHILDLHDDILLQSSEITSYTNSISYLEKCTCPANYGGLSCEICTFGYEMKTVGNDFTCEKIPVECMEGRTGDGCEECDRSKNYFPSNGTCVLTICNPDGSVSLEPNANGKCHCHENVEGDFCDRCKAGYFSLQDNCMKCWCSGISTDCHSSSLNISVISSTSLGGYNSSDGRNFWLLSSTFAGNLLASYKGYLNYTTSYAPTATQQSHKNVLTVELLTTDDVTIIYTHPVFVKPYLDSFKSWSVKLQEHYWKKSDNTSLTRNEFLSFLTSIKAVYIESPYHLSSGKVNLTSVQMTSATATEDGQRAWAVEECNCPPGYTGLSCEKCEENYYTSKKLGQRTCLKCDCPPEKCHPQLGCLDCPVGSYRSNPDTEPTPICEKCPCSGNEESCYKDSYEQIICNCKPGFAGLYCEVELKNSTDNFIMVAMTPREVNLFKIDSKAKFNCSYVSDKDLKVVIKKSYAGGKKVQVEKIDVQLTGNAYGNANIFDIVLEDGLEYVECFVYNKEDEVGCVRSKIISKSPTTEVKITNCNSDTIPIEEKETWDLICEASGVPAPMVTWYRTTQNNYMEKVSTIDGVHYIKSNETTLDRNGTIYTCIANNSAGSIAKCTQVLSVRKKCEKIHVYPKEVVVEEGETIFIQCKTTGNNSVAWSRSKGSLPSFRHTINNGLLNITYSEIDDSGTYICKAKTDTGYINDTAVVKVQEKRIPVTVTITDDDKFLQTGDNYTVTCEASGKPTPRVTWTKEKEYFWRNVVANNEELIITNAVIENTGIYKCTGRSGQEEAVDFIWIKVEEQRVKPQVTVNATGLIKVKEGQNLNLVCVSTKGVPKPTLEWLKKNSWSGWDIFSRGGILELKKVSNNHAGEYKCRGKNLAGEAEFSTKIEVLFPPKLNLSKEKMSVYEGDVVQLECLAIGYPKPKISWLVLPPTNFKINDSSWRSPVLIYPLESTKEQITFTASKNLHGSNITCSASNEAGTALKSAKLNILKQAVPTYYEVEFVPIGSYFELSCHPITGNVTWKKENGFLEGDICRVVSGLVIPSVQIQHRGIYLCVSETEIKNITLNVIGLPKFDQVHRSYMILPVALKFSSQLQIQITFRTEAENGLLLQKRRSEFDLFLKNGKINLYFHPKKGDVISVNSDVVLQLNKWYSVGILITTLSMDITIYDEKSSIVDKINKYFPKSDFGLILEDEFSVGGGFPRNGMATQRRLFMRIPSFEGCISRLTIEPYEFNLVADGSYSRNVSHCARCSEIDDPCQGKGKCFDAPTQYGFLCVCPPANGKNDSCPASCSLKLCETRLDLCNLINPCKRKDHHTCVNKVKSLECNCAFGYEGATCETVLEYSFCVKENGFVRLPASLLDRQSLQASENIEIKFVLHKRNGLLLWQGDRRNHLFIAVRDSRLEYVYLNQGIELRVRGNLDLPLEQKITLEANRNNNTALLKIQTPTRSDEVKGSTNFTTNRVKGDIYLGNLPSNNLYYSGKLSGLSGCINYVRFNRKPKVNFDVEALEKTNWVVTPLGPTTKKSSATKSDSNENYNED